MFVDEAIITVRAGRGGDGICSFRREMYVPRGGPDGGDGGNGGNVVLTASHRLTTLLDLRYQKHYQAEDGRPGGSSKCTGRSGADVVVTLPVGTVVYDAATDDALADLVNDGETVVIARGGRGGLGNCHFATSTNRAPTRWTQGTDGEERTLRLELKLLADVGLVGFPNAGKSTLIAAVSSARPKIAEYPFTTLTPHLGVVRWGSDRSFVVADIPGLIEGAHDGKGLGLQFLRHIERTAFLLHLIDVSEWTPVEPIAAFETVRRELAAYDHTLIDRPFAVVATKIDIGGTSDRLARLRDYCKRHRLRCFPVSSATREGLDDLIAFVGAQVDRLRSQPCETKS
ncbi:GTPase ObgE [Candidatus Nitrospira inopinata]|jgi:GTP-binding protein|uniref:GTPase Obg n=1 Tax=Candidatus Nitrospira inopinata TaxID=1715989 RepID=A0A0S4KY16_9BACT|nr:GTPase ObgE [Candidatus Nitrospira inopinata]CUQ68138.1 GTPase Obg [Candidatus Nitrospira inopinata]